MNSLLPGWAEEKYKAHCIGWGACTHSETSGKLILETTFEMGLG